MMDLISQPEFVEAWVGGAGPFHALAENVGQCLYLLNREGRCVAANRAFSQWLGRPQTEIVGGTTFDLWPRPLADKEMADLRRVLRGERIDEVEERPRGRQLLRVRVLRTPVRDNRGEVRGALCLFHEALSERDSDSSPRQASKMELLGRLAAGIVHDFNDLLSVQLNNLTMVQACLPPGHALEVYLHALQKAINQGVALTDRLLMLARQDGRIFRLIDLNGLCAGAVELLKHSIPPRIALELRLRPGLAPVQADSGEMTQVLMNLCFNACDAMPRGGHLRIETGERLIRPGEEVGSAAGRPGTFICLRVSDTGGAAPAEARSPIDEPSPTTASHGAGLGLDSVAEIVRRMGGWIDCGADGQGTRFTVYLPASSPSLQPDTPLPSRILGQRTVLVIENEPSIVQLTQTILERHGYLAIPAEDGQRALEIYRQRKEAIDLVVLEQNLPGLSGLETVNELLTINPLVRILLVTSGPRPKSSERSVTPGWGFLSKPYTADQFIQAVRAVLAANLKDEG